jgi:hypothetical protein
MQAGLRRCVVCLGKEQRPIHTVTMNSSPHGVLPSRLHTYSTVYTVGGLHLHGYLQRGECIWNVQNIRVRPFVSIQMVKIDRAFVCIGVAPAARHIFSILHFFQHKKHNLHSKQKENKIKKI